MIEVFLKRLHFVIRKYLGAMKELIYGGAIYEFLKATQEDWFPIKDHAVIVLYAVTPAFCR